MSLTPYAAKDYNPASLMWLPGPSFAVPFMPTRPRKQSSNIETLYQSRSPDDKDFEISKRPVPGCKKMAPYVATLFCPGKVEAYREQKAGRELLTNVPLSDIIPATPLN